jgi:hypothetical protein
MDGADERSPGGAKARYALSSYVPPNYARRFQRSNSRAYRIALRSWSLR